MTDNNGTIVVEVDRLIIGANGFFTRPLDEETVERYRPLIANLPAVEGWVDPETDEVHLLDGGHRVEAHRREGAANIKLIPFDGSREDAEVRSRVANMTHPLQLTSTLWRQAVTEVVRLRHTRSNNWIAEEANCSPITVKNIRLELEEAGTIPYLERLERKGGGTMPREFNRDKDTDEAGGEEDKTNLDETAEADAPLLNEADLLDQEEEEGEEQGTGWDSGSAVAGQHEGAPEEENRNGRHRGDELSDEAPGASSSRNGKEAKQKQQTLKFAPSGDEVLPAEVIIYVNGDPQSIPVTIMFAKGAIAGIPETSLEEHQRAAMVVDVEVGRQRGLVF